MLASSIDNAWLLRFSASWRLVAARSDLQVLHLGRDLIWGCLEVFCNALQSIKSAPHQLIRAAPGYGLNAANARGR